MERVGTPRPILEHHTPHTTSCSSHEVHASESRHARLISPIGPQGLLLALRLRALRGPATEPRRAGARPTGLLCYECLN